MLDQKPGKTYHYRYKFRFPNGLEKNFEVVLKADTLELVANKGARSRNGRS